MPWRTPTRSSSSRPSPRTDEAVRLIRALLERRLIACGTLLPGARSLYRWEGKIADESEVVVLLKTRGARLEALQAAFERLHPYKVPELLALPVTAGADKYLGWIDKETSLALVLALFGADSSGTHACAIPSRPHPVLRAPRRPRRPRRPGDAPGARVPHARPGIAAGATAGRSLSRRIPPVLAERAIERGSAWAEQGMQLCRKARWRDAIEPLRRATELNPGHRPAFYHLGDAFNHTDPLPAALEAFESATRATRPLARAQRGGNRARPDAAAPGSSRRVPARARRAEHGERHGRG